MPSAFSTSSPVFMTMPNIPVPGIGLSIVKKVAENHGSYVRAEGDRNVGARFFILLIFLLPASQRGEHG
jgi:signal transduction histidine kinase